MNAANALLVVVDLQERLVPAIDDGAAMVANTARLVAAAGALSVPMVATEQVPAKLGPTVAELAALGPAIPKTSFDACGAPAFLEAVPGDGDLVVAGCEAHVCVLQTVLSLRENRRRVCVVADAVGSRRPESRSVALARMAAHGAEIVTTEMVLFEWLRTAEHPQFRALSRLIR